MSWTKIDGIKFQCKEFRAERVKCFSLVWKQSLGITQESVSTLPLLRMRENVGRMYFLNSTIKVSHFTQMVTGSINGKECVPGHFTLLKLG